MRGIRLMELEIKLDCFISLMRERILNGHPDGILRIHCSVLALNPSPVPELSVPEISVPETSVPCP